VRVVVYLAVVLFWAMSLWLAKRERV